MLTVLLLPTLFALLPVGREVLEAITALLAVVVLFYVSFWLIARLEHKRWIEFVKARMWRAVSIGSTASLVLVGFTAVYREGFETALFYQALLTFGPGSAATSLLGCRARRRRPRRRGLRCMFRARPQDCRSRTFMNVAVAMVMVTSIAFLGNAVHTLQSADVDRPTPRSSAGPRLPIFLAEATGYWPTLQSVVAQVALAVVYIARRALHVRGQPRRRRRGGAHRPRSLAAPQAA